MNLKMRQNIRDLVRKIQEERKKIIAGIVKIMDISKRNHFQLLNKIILNKGGGGCMNFKKLATFFLTAFFLLAWSARGRHRLSLTSKSMSCPMG